MELNSGNMEPYTEKEIKEMLAGFGAAEASFTYSELLGMVLPPNIAEHKRLNKKIMEELRKPSPDREKLDLLINAINTVQNGEQQTTAATSPKENPQSDPTESDQGRS